jgi:alkanesulfonate monooxygenase SsuD/methylene tetrahydromethanopterin reductase-like flavin-dependent oxidoreductase (luciferase family)
MGLGFALPNIGPIGSPDVVTTVATRAEALGYDSLWMIERLLYPVQPQSPYPGTPDGSLPEPYQHCLDPLETLTFAAAQTTRVGLGPWVPIHPGRHPHAGLLRLQGHAPPFFPRVRAAARLAHVRS